MEPATNFRELVKQINRLLLLGLQLELPEDTTEASITRDLRNLADIIDDPEPTPEDVGREFAKAATDVAAGPAMLSHRSRGRRLATGRRLTPGRVQRLAEVVAGKRSMDDPTI